MSTVNLDDTPDPNSDLQANLNPYRIGDYIWKHIEDYFVSNYGIRVSQVFPSTDLLGPTVTWRVFKRTPGRGNSDATKKGANFNRFLKKENALIEEVYSQIHTIILEYAVFATSTSEANDIAWDLENAVLVASGLVQDEIPGFTINFLEQTNDSNMGWDRQDDVIVRICRFQVTAPISFTRVIPEISKIEIFDALGYTTVNGRFTRPDTSSIFYIPTEQGKKVVRINEVALFAIMNPFDLLIPRIDYVIKKDKDQIAYIEWTPNGKSPAVGQEFQVNYNIAASYVSRNIN